MSRHSTEKISLHKGLAEKNEKSALWRSLSRRDGCSPWGGCYK